MSKLQALRPVSTVTRTSARTPNQPTVAAEHQSEPETAVDLVRRAIVKNTVILAYQPVVHGNSPSKPAFYEGLIRVPDSNGEIIPAAAFITHVEENILGRMLDCCAVEQGVAELAAQPWLRLAINASPLSIVDPLWQATLKNSLDADPTVAERLIVEVTETSKVADMAQFVEQVDRVRNQGVSFALDDFGAGYTSFRILKEARFDIVKIDGQFIRNIHNDRDSQALTKALIDIATHFDMLVVAEAVEQQQEMDCLVEMKVDCMQGYLFGQPEILPSWSDELSRSARS